MVDILHKVGIKAPAAEVYEALTTTAGLADWWTNDTKADGDVLQFRSRWTSCTTAAPSGRPT
jgi:uncharacterized protein YndB with AHSA1/START domain